MARAGLNTADVVAAGAVLADEEGIGSVTIAALAKRLGVKAPALYKHVESLGDLQRRIAVLAITELGDAVRDALQAKAGKDALAAVFGVVQSYIAEHPGRYASTTGQEFGDADDPLLVASNRLINSLRAVLSSYGLPDDQLDHGIRALRCMMHGYGVLQAANGFQWSNDPDATVDWMIDFVDVGLRAVSPVPD